jgi:hypothetical protein
MMNVRDLIRELEKFPADMDVMLPVGYTFRGLERITDVDAHSVFFAVDYQTYCSDIPLENRKGGACKGCVIIR